MKYYSYWEEFIREWRKGGCMGIGGWSDPDVLPLYNNSVNKDFSSLYIPEPWWGNDGTQSLHSVVINFNPGEGGNEQERGIIPYKGSYANDVVNSANVLQETRCWHWSKRAKPILDSLKRLGYLSSLGSLDNHLSIELIPWHTTNVSQTAYHHYLKRNIRAIYDHIICFAAEESRRIENNKLKNVVLLRMNDAKIRLLLKHFLSINVRSCVFPTQFTNSKKGKYLSFKIEKIPDVKFVSIWGPKSRNDFPPSADLDEIIEAI